MKTYNNLFDQITAFSNLLLASRLAQRGKRFKESTAWFNLNLEKELLLLQSELQEMAYQPGAYRDFWVYDPKKRLISAAPYRDRVVHHALCRIIEPIFDRTFIYDTYACRQGKGTHAAVNRYTEYARKYKYVLKCDIQRYFPSIDHKILMALIARKIACAKTLWLIQKIIASKSDGRGFLYFDGDNLFTPIERKNGIPIGNLTSQFFANIYLNGFDHFVKETLCCHYIRYVDDFVLFADSKEKLWAAKTQIMAYLAGIRLKLHQNRCRVYKVSEGLGFLGYRMFPTHRRLKKGNALHMRRKLKTLSLLYRQGRISITSIHQSIQSWIGHAAHADTYRLRAGMFSSVVFQKG